MLLTSPLFNKVCALRCPGKNRAPNGESITIVSRRPPLRVLPDALLFGQQTNPFALRPGWKLGNRTQAVTPPLPSGYASDLTSAARHISAAQPASNDTEAWMNHLQWLHLLEGGLRGRDTRGRRLTRWADWLLPPPPPPTSGTGFATAAAAEGTLEENGEEGEGEGSVVRGSVDDGADMGGDTTCGLGAYFREPDCASSPPGGSDAATAHETAESGETFPPPAESSSVASSSPSWVLAADASTGSSSSSSSSSSPLSFGMTSLLDDDGAGTTTATPAAAEAHESTNGAPSCSSPSPSFDETTASVEITSSANGDDNNGGAEATKVEQGSTQVPKDTQQCLLSAASQRVLAAILREFDLAEGAVAEARQTLLDKGFSQPSRGHVLQVLRNAREDKCQDQVEDSVEAREAGQLRMQGRGGSASSSSAFLASVALSVHGGGVCPLGAKSAPQNDLDSASTVATALLRGSGDDADEGGSWFGAVDGDKEAVGSWGFRDSGFCLESDRADGGDPYVLMRGNRSVLFLGSYCWHTKPVSRSSVLAVVQTAVLYKWSIFPRVLTDMVCSLGLASCQPKPEVKRFVLQCQQGTANARNTSSSDPPVSIFVHPRKSPQN